MATRNRHKPYSLDKKKVKHRMIDLGTTVTEVGRLIGASKMTVSRHIHGHRHNPAIQRAIARILRVKIADICQESHDGNL